MFKYISRSGVWLLMKLCCLEAFFTFMYQFQSFSWISGVTIEINCVQDVMRSFVV